MQIARNVDIEKADELFVNEVSIPKAPSQRGTVAVPVIRCWLLQCCSTAEQTYTFENHPKLMLRVSVYMRLNYLTIDYLAVKSDCKAIAT